jgi:hypothetical protein
LIPTFSYLPLSEYDDVSSQGCNYVNQMIYYRYYDIKNFVSDGNYALPLVGYTLAQAYGWSKDQVNGMSYIQFQQLGDVIYSENFDG